MKSTASDACESDRTVNAEEEVTVTASEFGDVANHFLNVTNNEEQTEVIVW